MSSHSLTLWIGLGVALFWSVGAYKRMVRLRAEVRRAFVALDVRLAEQLGLLQSRLPPSMHASLLTQPGELLDDISRLWIGLRSAAAQVAASLAAARAHPLDARALGALAAARSVLDTTWQRMPLAQADPAGTLLPEAVQRQWEQGGVQAYAAVDQFNQAVARYNAAVSQFPAVLLAWVCGFKAARAL